MALLWPLHTLLPEWQPTNLVQDKAMKGKVAIVTGSNAGTGCDPIRCCINARSTGIGYEAALTLAQAGAHVIVAARNRARGEDAVRRLREGAPGALVDFMQVDMASIASIVAFADAFTQRGLPLHVLVQNAGVFLLPPSITADGLEVRTISRLLPCLSPTRSRWQPTFWDPTCCCRSWPTHWLPPAPPVSCLWHPPRSRSAPSPPWTTSRAPWASYANPMNRPPCRGTRVHEPKLVRYGTTKLWTLMCVPEWQRRLGPRGVDVLACHPGLCKSSLFSKYSPVRTNASLLLVYASI